MEQRFGAHLGKGVLELALVAGEVEREHRQGAHHRVEIGADRGALRGDLGGLEPHRAVDRRVVVVDAPHAAEVDELEIVAGVHHVVGLEIAVEEPAPVQVTQGGQHAQQVADGLIDGQRIGATTVGHHAVLQHLFEALAADELTDDAFYVLFIRSFFVLLGWLSKG